MASKVIPSPKLYIVAGVNYRYDDEFNWEEDGVATYNMVALPSEAAARKYRAVLELEAFNRALEEDNLWTYFGSDPDNVQSMNEGLTKILGQPVDINNETSALRITAEQYQLLSAACMYLPVFYKVVAIDIEIGD